MPALNETVSVSRRTHRALATRTVGDKMPLVWQPEHRDQSFGNLSDGYYKSNAATEDRLQKWDLHWTVLIVPPSPYKTICKKILIAEQAEHA